MLGSFLRILLFLVLVALGIALVAYLVETPGEITINFANQEYYFTPLAFVVALFLGFVALWLLFKILGFLVAVFRFIIGDETAVSRYFDRSRHRRGLDAYSAGLTALAAGESRRALDKAQRAERLLDRPKMTRLLTAQAADSAGERELARAEYTALAEDPDTAFVGVRGLMDQALAEGDTDRAFKLAQSGLKLKPREPHTLETLYTLQSQRFDWAGARRTLAQQRKAGLLEKPEVQRRDAMLALAQAEDAEEAGEEDEARRLALEAAKADPANVEAASAAARLLTKDGSKRQATRLLVDAWKHNPSPQLAAAYAAIEPDESPAERRRRFGKLLAANPEHPEARFTEAELALTTDDFRGARKSISDLRETEPSARSCAIMAAVARGEGAPESEVRGWLARALGAPRGTAPDTLIGHAAMLPLLIGDDIRTTDGTDPPQPVEPGEEPAAGGQSPDEPDEPDEPPRPPEHGVTDAEQARSA
ncbi:MAG TPA: heme biosynthesis HemY N-terminal domain-containing protein [Thermohalobaculum sp.]|nr:heme biosynthesis HemY N-terminal domain-containing protein [Thermohalobaculum sp.]